MAWLAREPDRRADPARVLPGVRSIIVAGLNYWQPQPAGRGRIARYDPRRRLPRHSPRKIERACERNRGVGRAGQGLRRHRPPSSKNRSPSAPASAGRAKAPCSSTPGSAPGCSWGRSSLPSSSSPMRPCRTTAAPARAASTPAPPQAITAPYQLDARRCIRLPHHRAQGRHPGRNAPPHRRPRLRLRRMPRRLPLEPLRPNHARNPLSLAPARDNSTPCSKSPSRNSSAATPKAPSSASNAEAFSATSA